MLKGIDTSAIKYIQALSATALTAAGSTNAIDLSNFTHATLVFQSGSTGAATITADMVRASASNGTFHNFGASVSAGVAGKTHVRSWVVGGSEGWYKVYYTQTGSGSPTGNALIVAAGTREAVIDQDTNTTSYSVINST